MATETTTPRDDDAEFEEARVANVSGNSTDGWSIERSDGWSFGVRPDSPIVPKVGMTARLYGRGLGYTVRGLMLDGVTVFYETAEQHSARMDREHAERDRERRYDFEKNRTDFDRRYRALPEVFQRRLDKFRGNNPDFRWKYESYEMFCCEQAVEIAAKVKADDLPEFANLDFAEQRLIVPNLSDGHSGNTFGCAVRLAHLYLTNPEGVVQLHGAMAPLVGSEEYGCVAKGGAS